MKTQIQKQRNQTSRRFEILLGMIAVFGIWMFSGCQESLNDTKTQALLQKESVVTDKVPTLVVFPDEDSIAHVEQPKMERFDTESSAERLMSTYEKCNTLKLSAGKIRKGTEDTKCVPILVINY